MKNLFIAILVTILAVFFFSAVEQKQWNGGYCYQCGNEYQAIGVSRTGSICYYCDNCYTRIYY